MVDLPKLSDGASLLHHTADASLTLAGQTTCADFAEFMQSRKVYDTNAKIEGALPGLELTAATPTPALPMDGALSPLQKALDNGSYQRRDFTSPDGKVTIPVFMPTNA
jgi:hypothetical protein